MRKLMFAATILTLSLTTVYAYAEQGDRTTDSQRREIRFQHLDNPKWTHDEVERTIRAAVARWPVPGGASTALRIASCESGLYYKAENTSSGAAGIFQFLPSTWSSARAHYRKLGRRLDLSWRVWNARANVIVAARMAHEGGWSPWGCS